MTDPAGRRSLFLERGGYRRRRLIDAARLLPVLGLFLWCVPLLWGLQDGVRGSRALLYLFGVWAALVVAAALLAGHLRDDGDGGGRRP